jgi:hypothetical protein
VSFIHIDDTEVLIAQETGLVTVIVIEFLVHQPSKANIVTTHSFNQVMLVPLTEAIDESCD